MIALAPQRGKCTKPNMIELNTNAMGKPVNELNELKMIPRKSNSSLKPAVATII